ARVPAWCDRILWWTRDPDTRLNLKRFESVEQITISDHKPVRACFALTVRSIDQISITVVIDKEISWELKDTKLQDILVMNLEHGRDYFVPVTAQYYPRCFGVSLEHLMKRKLEPEKNLIDFGDGLEEDEEICPPNIPREVYRLICALQRLGTQKLDLNDIVDNSTFITVRNALENDFPKDLTQLQVPALALYSALLRLFDTLKGDGK
ncbi:hypothetical protein ANCCEY_04745, partial [Ancylostoma ceylanicum]